MFSFNDATTEVEERNDTRMNFRTSLRIKRTIQQAAALAGVDDTSFVIGAAYASAKATIAAHEQTALSAVDHEAFFAALDAAPAPTQKLRDAYSRHRETIVSR